GRPGSAPFSSSSFISATSPDRAARRKGVWPVKSTHERSPRPKRNLLVGGTSAVRAFGLAPLSSRLVINLNKRVRSTLCSPERRYSTLRISTAAQRGVLPQKSAVLISAPCSIRKSAVSGWLFVIAMSNGLILLASARFTFDPAAISI